MAKVIQVQPSSQVLEDHDTIEYLEKFKIEEVVAWSPNDVVDKFLSPMGLKKYAMQFIDHKVTGLALLLITGAELKELQMEPIGDRKKFLGGLAVLQKGKRQLDLEAIIWSGTYPPPKSEPNCPYAYYDGVGHFCAYHLCYCFVPTAAFKISRTGLASERIPAPCYICCTERSVDFKDFRFLKDINRQYEPCCLWCCKVRVLNLKFAQPNDESKSSWYTIRHPRVTKALESSIRQIWGETRLVASRM